MSPDSKKMCQKGGRRFEFKISLLFIHGFLHLLGYDHEKLKDGKEMFTLQEKIMAKLSD